MSKTGVSGKEKQGWRRFWTAFSVAPDFPRKLPGSDGCFAGHRPLVRRPTAACGPQQDPCSGSVFLKTVLVFLSPQFSFWLNEGSVQPLPARTPVDISLRCRERLHNRVPGQACIKNPLRGPFLSLSPSFSFFSSGAPTRARTELTGSVQIMALLAWPPTSAEKRTWTRRRRPP